MSTALSRNYAHCWETFSKGIDSQGPYYEVVYKFDDWADSDRIPNELIGLTSRVGGTGGVTIRGTPHQHPLSTNLYCREAKVEGVGPPVLNSLGLPYYAQGFLVRAIYRSSLPEGVIQASDDPYFLQQIDAGTPILWATQELDFDTEFVTLPNNQSQWLSTGKKTGLPLKVQIGITTLRITFHRVPYMPTPALRNLRGKVNLGTFLNAAEGCVLFLGGRTSREYSTDGSVNQQVTLHFKERDHPWYQTLRPDTLVWDGVTDPAGNLIYNKASFAPLVQV